MSLLLTRAARRRLLAAEPGATVSGRLAVGGFAAARRLAERLGAGGSGPPLRAGQLNAYSLLEETLNLLLTRCLELDPGLLRDALELLDRRLGEQRVDQVLESFAEEFQDAAAEPNGSVPSLGPSAALRVEALGEPRPQSADGLAVGLSAAPAGEARPSRYAEGPALSATDRPGEGPTTPAAAVGDGGAARRQNLLRGLLVFWLLDANPALRRPVAALHSGGPAGGPGWTSLTAVLAEFLAARPAPPALDPGGTIAEAGADSPVADSPGMGSLRARSLLELLQAPARHSPDSLAGQLRFVLERWRPVLGSGEARIASGLDLLAEEERPRFPPGPGPAEVPAMSELAVHEARYSPDVGWMPGLVLVAKNLAVWLDQLSKSEGRPVRRLDQIPDAALAELAGRGFTGLWLIGVWERSPASKRIKRLCGRREATASAYSVRAYRVAADLGGEEALATLTARAAGHGLRLAADMVPNHMGIDSDWVLEQPERFLSVAECPYPSYTFGGPDLSPDPRVGIFLEDHYYDRTDAAVVFKRLDRPRGEVRYLYHGNDGTSTPWNDTAQLDHLDAATREALILTILEVARRFPIVRFDAAMTLARRHYQRLWHPLPGSGGAIPSRAEHALSQEAFDRRMPAEFWRQVVDRVAAEAPGTLLLAEAFWLTEGYFVRTLGMHRVYNSAFMNMLRDQENAKFRQLLRETLAFDPRILGRWVNFMSNPDERTAVAQFGSGDRYFGICVLMATLPGLPMFAHGQVEGFTERYGMEFGRAYLAEEPDPALVERHRRQILPLLRRRSEFAAAENFHLFDLVGEDGKPREAVVAFVTGAAGRRLLVVFHNRAAAVRGRLVESAPRRRPDGELESETLAAALGLPADRSALCRYRDELSGLEFLRPGAGGRGLDLELGPYGTVLLSGFQALTGAAAERWRPLAERLGLAGVPDLEQAAADLRLEPARQRLDDLLARLVAATGLDGPGSAALEPLAADFRRLQEELHSAGLLPEDQDLPDPLPGWRAVFELPSLAATRATRAASREPPAGGRSRQIGKPPERRPGRGAGEGRSLDRGSAGRATAARLGDRAVPQPSAVEPDAGQRTLNDSVATNSGSAVSAERETERSRRLSEGERPGRPSRAPVTGVLPWPGAGRSQREIERLADWLAGEPVIPAALCGSVLLVSLRAGGAELTSRLAVREALARRLAALAPGTEELAERKANLAAWAAVAGWLRPQPPPGPDELADVLPEWSSYPKGEAAQAARHPGVPAPDTPELPTPDQRAPGLETIEELLNWRLATATIAQIEAAAAGADPVEAAQAVVGWCVAIGRLRQRATGAGEAASAAAEIREHPAVEDGAATAPGAPDPPEKPSTAPPGDPDAVT